MVVFPVEVIVTRVSEICMRHKPIIPSFLMVCILLSLFPLCAAASEPVQWGSWRGPYQNGSAAPTALPPRRWSDGCAGSWKLELPGTGSATPIVWEDRIFVVSAQQTERTAEHVPQPHPDAKTQPPASYFRFIATAVDRLSGRVIWQKDLAEQVPHEGRHPTHTYAAASPVTDGDRLYVSFGSRGIFCLTLDGELLWETDPGDMRTRFGWGECVTPALAGDRLIVNWDAEEGSFITALNTQDGDEVWRQERPGELTSWNTPLVTRIGQRTAAVVNGSGLARAYDTETGEVIWECGGQTTNAIPSPVRSGDLVICMSGYRGAAAIGIPLESRGNITGSDQIRWVHSRGTPYVPSPALSDNRLYFTAGRNGILTVLNSETGEPVAERIRLDGIDDCYASPLVADGHVYICGRDGTAVVIEDQPPFRIVQTNRLTGNFDASPVAVADQLLLRSWDVLYSFRRQ